MPRVNIGHTLQATNAHHAGLWFDKYLRSPAVKKDKPPVGGNNKKSETDEQLRQKHVLETTQIREPAIYKPFFEDWEAALTSVGATTDKFARTLGRLAVGLGNEGVIETSLTLHRTYGVPYIPGSALKGLAAHYANNRLGEKWNKASDAYKIVFGYSDKPEQDGTIQADAGYITFFDALYVPGSGKGGQALYPDVITVHHPDYYNQENPSAPADWDSPTPIPFVSTTGSFLLALAGPSPEWVETAYDILGHALLEWGIGAKTSSGYGRMVVTGYDDKLQAMLTRSAEKKEAKKQANAAAGQAFAAPQTPLDLFIDRIQRLRDNEVAGQIANFVPQWERLDTDAAGKKRAAQAMVEKVRKVGKEKQFSEKPWFQKLNEAIQ